MDELDLVHIVVLSVMIMLTAWLATIKYTYENVSKTKLKSYNTKLGKQSLKLAENVAETSLALTILILFCQLTIVTVVSFIFIDSFNVFEMLLSALATTLVLVLLTKTLAGAIAEDGPLKYALYMSPLARALVAVIKPITTLYLWIQRGFKKVFNLTKRHSLTDEEVLSFVDEIESGGTIDKQEGELIRSVLDFGDLKVTDIFTPRMSIVAVHIKDTKEEIKNHFFKSGYSRLPVYETSIDQIIGTINHKDFFQKVVHDNQSLKSIIKPAFFVTEYMKIADLLTFLQQKKSHFAVVLDEFGGTLGLVTMEDVIEELVGDIFDEHDEIIQKIKKIDENTYQVKGSTYIDDFFDLIGLDDEEIEHATINGWVIEEFGKIPVASESFSYLNLDVTVLSADDKKVSELLIKVNKENEA